MNSKILIIDDNTRLASSLSRNFALQNIHCDHAVNQEKALNHLNQTDYAIILLDLRLGEESGLDVMKAIRRNDIYTPIIIITGNATVDSAIKALRLGVIDYIRKPVAFSSLFKTCEKYISESEDDLIPGSADANEILSEARKIAKSDLPVLITGESGTGKDVLAEYIHMHSHRSGEIMLKQNCASLPGSLLENELFGHAKGAYTGADSSFKGIFERADKSTLFLDEIGEMPLDQQSKILRVLQDREIRRIGGETLLHVDVRFITATNQSLPDLLDEHRLRQDLYYRLNAGHIHLRPLRERTEEIQGLAKIFCEEFSGEDSTQTYFLTDDALDILHRHQWPGNIRELKNVIHYACTMSEGPKLKLEDLPRSLRTGPGITTQRSHPTPLEPSTLAQNERELIMQTLSRTRYNKKRTAEYLSISRTTLYEKIRKYGIEV